jgi:hypothetical protein
MRLAQIRKILRHLPSTFDTLIDGYELTRTLLDTRSLSYKVMDLRFATKDFRRSVTHLKVILRQ